MLKLIIGVKGTGKTKQLIELVHESLASSNGNVVCIEKGDKLRFDVNYQCRLIDAESFDITDAAALYGFVAGIFASNHDVTDLFIDSALKICKDNVPAFDELLPKLDAIAAKSDVKLVITSSIAVEDATDVMKKYM